MRARLPNALILIALVALSQIACTRIIEHRLIVEENYEGPVVVLFGIEAGVEIPINDSGVYMYEIPTAGYLAVCNQLPESARNIIRVFSANQDGRLVELSQDTRDAASETVARNLGVGATTVYYDAAIDIRWIHGFVGTESTKSSSIPWNVSVRQVLDAIGHRERNTGVSRGCLGTAPGADAGDF